MHETIKKTCRNLIDHLSIFFSYLFFPISLALRMLNFRVIEHGPVIGNLCTQIDAFVKERRLQRIPNYKLIIYPHFRFRLNTANNYLLHLWKQHFYVVTNPLLGALLRFIFAAPWLRLSRPYF